MTEWLSGCFFNDHPCSFVYEKSNIILRVYSVGLLFPPLFIDQIVEAIIIKRHSMSFLFKVGDRTVMDSNHADHPISR